MLIGLLFWYVLLASIYGLQGGLYGVGIVFAIMSSLHIAVLIVGLFAWIVALTISLPSKLVKAYTLDDEEYNA